MPVVDKFHYRPEIDGLRAIAVLAVVLFHGGFGCPGGFVGVDVFFVISGFLITSLIWKDLENGNFSFANFWERRARRILPALIVVSLAVLVAGWFLLMPTDYEGLGRASAAQAVFGANVFYWLDSGYFSIDAREKPLLHTWSLAVEEQFYLLVPFLFWALYRVPRWRRRETVLSFVAVGFALSLALSVYAVRRHPQPAFYLLPTRAWELLLGSIVAFLPAVSGWLRNRLARELFAAAGLWLIYYSVFRYTEKTPFPGLAALAPCLGAALLIWTNTRLNEGADASGPPTLIGVLLARPKLVFIGLISYSLYLWHWPLLAFSKAWALTPVSDLQNFVMLVLGFVLAVLSWKYIETPFRERRLGTSRKQMFAFSGLGLAAILGGGLLCGINGFPGRLSPQSQQFARIATDFGGYSDVSLQDARAGKFYALGAKDTKPPTVFVWGDSHARAALPAIDLFLKQKGLVGRGACHSAIAPVLGWYKYYPWAMGEDAIPYNEAIFSYIQNHKIPDVILIGRWEVYFEDDPKQSTIIKEAKVALLKTVRKLVAIGSRPCVMLDTPTQDFDVAKALSNSFYSPAYLRLLCARPTTWNELNRDDATIMDELKAAGATIIDPKPGFLDPTRQHYLIQSAGVPLYRDKHHLSVKGAELILLPFFQKSWRLGPR